MCAVASEQRVEFFDRCRVMHADDPFGPSHVFHHVAEVSQLPIHQTNDANGAGVEEKVLNAEVPMYGDSADAF